MGDSLSAGFGIPKSQSWVALLKQRLAAENLPHNVVNASISGETTSGGLNRLKLALNQYQPQTIIIELGANDGLRGLSLTLVRQNLSRMIRASQQADTQVLLLGMRLPPNYGPRYTRNFAQIFVDLAEEYDTGLVPFFLTQVATRRELMQSDGLHPTAAAQPQLLNTVWAELLPLLGK
ncbi:MAG: arylesterase [Ectothiorhodospiraceae bacterium]|nr:arylesterase [Ectothiorhodospiraceae bacterium]